MMYLNKLAAAIKSNGKILREFKDNVYVPFGSEYSIFVKNLNSVRALVKIEIDGEDVTEGTQLIVNANDSIDLERYIRNGNLQAGNRFKFIERTANIENHRGVGVEDGLIRIEFQFEKIYTINYPTSYTITTTSNPIIWNNTTAVGSNFLPPSTSPLRGICGSSTAQSTYTANSTVTQDAEYVANVVNDAGITVPGSESDQQFQIGSWFPVEHTKHVMVLKLLGETEEGRVIAKPITVKAKPKCVTCGRTNKATAKFCTECGTSLKIV